MGKFKTLEIKAFFFPFIFFFATVVTIKWEILCRLAGLKFSPVEFHPVEMLGKVVLSIYFDWSFAFDRYVLNWALYLQNVTYTC